MFMYILYTLYILYTMYKSYKLYRLYNHSKITTVRVDSSTLRHINIYIYLNVDPDEQRGAGGVFAYNDMCIFCALYHSKYINMQSNE